ncbi:MAG: response regulator [Acidobacteriota bacterium]
MERETILIVDDDVNQRTVLVDILKQKQAFPFAVADGESALEWLKTERPAVALIDLKLPGLSGLELLNECKKVSPNTACIVVTGHGSEDLASQVANAGGYGYLKKPYGLEELLLLIQRALEQRKADITLRDSEERYRSVVQSSHSAVIVADVKQKIVSWNPAATQMFGYEEQEATGMPIELLMAQRFRDGHRKGIDQICATEGAGEAHRKLQVNALKKDGSEFPIELSLSSWLTETGRAYCALIRDLTEENTLKEQLFQSQKMEAIGILAGGVAHDFNNILTGINGLSSLVLEQLDSDSMIYDDLREIHELGGRAAGLTRQLLTFSRQLPPKVTQLNLDSLITNFMKIMTRVIGEDVDLQVKSQAGNTIIKADGGQIEQILMNLAVNSRDAMPNGGKFTIQTERVKLAFPRREVPAGSYLTLTVSDNGCGIDPKTIGRIFDPFFTTKDVGKGTGLGLSTVYGIVKQHDGYIELNSKTGEGTTFTIYFPVLNQGSEEFAQPDSHRKEDTHTKVILLAEDDRPVRRFAERVLKGEGFTLHSTENPAQARLLFSEHRQEIDLLITDVIMPGGNGSDLYRELLAQKPDLKVLFMSGYTGGTSRVTEIRDQGHPFLPKPFEPHALIQKVLSVLQR